MDTIETGFSLDAIKQEVEWQEWNEDWQNEGMEARGVFLGTVFALLPSGKYYTPWACSNVDPCETCKGKGEIDNPQYDAQKHDEWIMLDRSIRSSAMDIFGAWCNGEWPKQTIRQLDITSSYVTQYQKTLVCETCNGLGSSEAYQDQLWYEQAERELDSIGLTLESGEGDPCDLFAMEYKDI